MMKNPCAHQKKNHLQNFLAIFVHEKGRVGSYDHMKHNSQSMFRIPGQQHPKGWRDRSANAIQRVLPLQCLFSSSGMEGKIMAVFGFMPVIAMTLPYVPFSIVYVSLYLSAPEASVTIDSGTPDPCTILVYPSLVKSCIPNPNTLHFQLTCVHCVGGLVLFSFIISFYEVKTQCRLKWNQYMIFLSATKGCMHLGPQNSDQI